MGHYHLLSAEERARLRREARILVAEKVWEGCGGLQVTEIMKITVAAQAALLLLGLDHDYFARVLSVVLFPSDFELPAEPWQSRGTVISGQAVNYGSVFLAWGRVLTEGRDPSAGRNLVIHEFAHQLDFLDGYPNGVPVLRNRDQTRRWQEVMKASLNRLRRELRAARRTILGSYAATSPTEFFSVASERFFLVPARLQHDHPSLYEVLAEYYRADPLRWFAGVVPARKPETPPGHHEPSPHGNLEMEDEK
jgi:MtfA peptidase